MSSLRLLIASLEAVLVSMEMMCGVQLLSEAGKSIMPFAIANNNTVILLNIGVTFIALWWVLTRFGWGIGLSTREVISRMGLTTPRVTQPAILLMTLHVTGLVIMAAIQSVSGEGHLSWNNWLIPGTQAFDAVKAVNMLLLIPLREEIVCRAIVFTLFYKHLGSPNGISKFVCVLLSSSVFGSLHLLNFFALQPHSTSYIILQIGLGSLIGMFYTFRFLEVNVTEPVFLHSFNNAVSCFLTDDITLLKGDGSLLVPLTFTLIVYSILVWYSSRKLLLQPSASYPLLPITEQRAIPETVAKTARISKKTQTRKV